MPPNYSICTKLLHRWTGKAIHLLQKANSEERFCKKVTDVIIVITSFLEFPDLSKTCWAIPNSVTHINKKIYDICTFTSIFSVTSRRYLIRSVRYLCSLLFIATMEKVYNSTYRCSYSWHKHFGRVSASSGRCWRMSVTQQGEQKHQQ